MIDLLYKSEVYAIIGAAMEVYNELGPGFLEAVYQESLEIELSSRGIPFESQPSIPVTYKGQQLKKFYVPDLLLYTKIVVELKAENSLTLADEAQLLNQLRVTGMELGLLVNFGADSKLDWARRVNTKKSIGFPPKRLAKIGEELA